VSALQRYTTRAEGHSAAGYLQSVRDRVGQVWEQVKQTPVQQLNSAQAMIYEAAMLAILGLCWAFCCMGSERAFRRATKEDLKRGDFQPVGFFSCFSWQVMHVCEACLCYQFMWAETMSKLKVAPFWALLACVTAGIVLGPLTAGITVLLLWAIRVYTRTMMRNKFGQQGGNMDPIVDCCAHLVCCFCATAQEAEFVEHCDHHGLLNV